jgi:hypothetical protein
MVIIFDATLIIWALGLAALLGGGIVYGFSGIWSWIISNIAIIVFVFVIKTFLQIIAPIKTYKGIKQSTKILFVVSTILSNILTLVAFLLFFYNISFFHSSNPILSIIYTLPLLFVLLFEVLRSLGSTINSVDDDCGDIMLSLISNIGVCIAYAFLSWFSLLLPHTSARFFVFVLFCISFAISTFVVMAD